MRLEKVIIKNFRSYTNQIELSIDQLTALIGKNDVGKSAILDALDVFFNKGKLDKEDRNVHCGEEDVTIGCVFSRFPEEIILDDSAITSLKKEYLLNADALLEIHKKYSVSGKESVYIVANHPSNEHYNNLLQKKNNDLKSLIKSAGLQDTVNLSINTEMRTALWESLGEDILFLNPWISSWPEQSETA